MQKTLHCEHGSAQSVTTIAAIGCSFKKRECHHGAAWAWRPNALLACLRNPCPNDYLKEDLLVRNVNVLEENVTTDGRGRPNALLAYLRNPCPNDYSKALKRICCLSEFLTFVIMVILKGIYW